MSTVPRRRFVGRTGTGTAEGSRKKVISAQQPVAEDPPDPLLLATIDHVLPRNYNFEIVKTVKHIKKNNATTVGLQLPEGLQMYACAISDILERFTGVDCVVLGDVTYGACCIDDYTAVALGCDMLVHYGHSCLVPVDRTMIKTLYVFVEIGVDRVHLAQTVRLNFPKCIDLASDTGAPAVKIGGSDPGPSKPTKIALVGTIQFVSALHDLREDFAQSGTLLAIREQEEPALTTENNGDEATGTDDTEPLTTPPSPIELVIPQIRPLSPGEILGCTAPTLDTDVDAILYVGDGRFHLESVMIANPTVPAFRYDPYSKKLTYETYDHRRMRETRSDAITVAKNDMQSSGDSWIIFLGTLGRQGNLGVMNTITSNNASSKLFIPVLLSELSPYKVALFKDASAFIQTSCPRLSIDWGYAFEKPLLTPYEVSVILKELDYQWKDHKEAYPMDFYADYSLGPWTPRYKVKPPPRVRRR